MKALQNVAVVVAVLVAVSAFAGIAGANEKMHHKDWTAMCQEKIKTLKDSAAMLEKTEPALAKGLNDLAAQEEKRLQEMMEMKAKRDADSKLLRDSAAALQKTNPDAAKELWDMSECKPMKKGWGMGMGKGCPMMDMKHREAEEHEGVAE